MAAAGSSRFAVTCGLMRQYMRDQQQGGATPAVSLLLSPPSEETDARTMQLFPTSAPSLPQTCQQRPEAQTTTAPLTIIYDGRVVVFDDFPAEKAKALMQMAGSESKSSSPEPAKKVAAPSTAELSDLPIARKVSLQRFLQKRKHRISTSDPYQKARAEKDDAAEVKPAKDEPASWLGL